MATRTTKKTNRHKSIDITKPVDVNFLMQSVGVEDCFSKEWAPGDNLCNLCSEFELCGILYNARLAKREKEIEKANGVTFLDNMRFDEIEPADVVKWLRHKPRTGKQFIDMIEKVSGCSDRVTCRMWCSSFVEERDNISIENKIITVA